MSQLKVEKASLDKDAQTANQAVGYREQVKVNECLSKVADAMPGSSSVGSATRAGASVDGESSKLMDGLATFSEALEASKEAYVKQDKMTSVEFNRFNNALEGKK